LLRRELPIEDRLLKEGVRTKIIKKHVTTAIDERIKAKAKPRVSPLAKKMPRSKEQITDRLLKYKVIYEIKLDDLKQRHDPNFTYSPEISKYTRDLARTKKSRSPSPTRRRAITPNRSLRFTPKISKRTTRLAER
jgi:hypothetical protein